LIIEEGFEVGLECRLEDLEEIDVEGDDEDEHILEVISRIRRMTNGH
jgi:hypothetical protein